MNFIKATLSLVAAGALLAGYGLLTQSAAEPASLAKSQLASVTTLDPINGLAPLHEVVDLFESRSNERPSDYLSRTQLGQALNAQAREEADLVGYEHAEHVLTEALVINPRWQPAQLALARSLHAQHRFDEAQTLAEEVLAEDPGSLAALATLGDASLELGDLATARRTYQDLAAAERSAPVVSRLARLSSLGGDAQLAVDLAIEALELSGQLALRPNAQAFYQFQLGHMYFNVGAIDPAITAYEQARSLDPGNPAATEALAFALATQGEHAQAVALYQELIGAGPAPDLYGSLADSLAALGHKEEAREQLVLGTTLAAETADRFPAERRHLVSFYQTVDPARAVELAREDLESRQDWAAYDTLAWALHHAGDDIEAAAVLALAPVGDPPTAAMLYHHAEVLAQTGAHDQAVELAAKALALNPHFHPTEAAAARLLVDRLSP